MHLVCAQWENKFLLVLLGSMHISVAIFILLSLACFFSLLTKRNCQRLRVIGHAHFRYCFHLELEDYPGMSLGIL